MANTILTGDGVNSPQVNADLINAKSVVVTNDVQTEDSLMRGSQLYVAGAIPAQLVSGYVYDLGVINSTQDLSAISFQAAPGYVQTCEVWMETGATGYSVTWPANSKWPDEYLGNPPTVTLAANKRYRFAVRSEGDGTMVITKAYEYSL